MSNLVEISEFTAGIYQIETNDDVLGGENGIANAQAKALANRTKWLNDNKAAKNGNAINKFEVANPTTQKAAVNKEYADGNYVRLYDDQTIAGIKTFNKFPLLPLSDPVNNNDGVNKQYVDKKSFEFTLVDKKEIRDSGLTYINTDSKPRKVIVSAYHGSSAGSTAGLELLINNKRVQFVKMGISKEEQSLFISEFIPVGASYRILIYGSSQIEEWNESKEV